MADNPNKSKEGYHVLDFQNLNEKGLAKLVSAVKQAGTEIAEVIPAGPARKKDGVSMKQFSLVDLAGQTMTFNVTDTGDISGVSLNGKVMPESPPTSLKDMATKIAKNFEKTEVSFQASLARKVAKQARLDADKESKESNKKAAKTQGQRLVEAKEKLEAAQSALTELRQTVSQRVTQQTANNSQLQQLTEQLSQEVALTGTLKQQIAALKKGA